MSCPALRAGAVIAWLVASALVAAPSTLAGPRVESLRVDRTADRLLVSFDVDGAFSERALERLAAGLPLVFRHSVELQSRRALPLWFPRVVARASIVNRAEYDSLTRHYRLSRTGDAWAEPCRRRWMSTRSGSRTREYWKRRPSPSQRRQTTSRRSSGFSRV